MPLYWGHIESIRHPRIALTRAEALVAYRNGACRDTGRIGSTPTVGGIASMRTMVSAVLATGLLSAGIAAAQPCAKPADVTAFDVASLKSKLMVTALTCNQQDRYNDFVQAVPQRPDDA